jgi:hypothetical protein
MKRLLLICIALAFIVGEGASQTTGAKLSNAELLKRMEANAPQLYRSYKTGKTISIVGMSMTIGGALVGIIGLSTAESTTTHNGGGTQVNFEGAEGAIGMVGVLVGIAGIPTWIIGNKKKKNARTAYINEFGDTAYRPAKVEKASAYVELRPTGIALVF